MPFFCHATFCIRSETQMSMRKQVCHLVIGLLVSLASPPVVAGQSSLKATRHVTVVLVDSLPRLRVGEEYVAVIIRRPELKPADIILIPRSGATGTVLDAAVRTLLDFRVRNRAREFIATRSGHSVTIGVRESTAAPYWRAKYGDRVQRIMDSLVVAPRKLISGIGTFPALDIVPPRPRSAT